MRTPKGGNKPIALLHNTSIMDVRLKLPNKQDVERKDKIQILTLPAALVSCSPGFYSSNPVEARAVLSMISNAAEILPHLLQGGHSTIAGRLAGAFRNIGRNVIADDIVDTMKAAGYSVSEKDPFEYETIIIFGDRELSPYVNRMRMSWAAMRNIVLMSFPEPPSLSSDVEGYLRHVDDIYLSDAYHSLSIEGYRVSEELIDRVRSGEWNPEDNRNDKEYADAMAARGYWQAFKAVKDSVVKILNGYSAGKVVEDDHTLWYRELFAPSVSGGITTASDLAGYRNQPVHIRRSMHVPPRYEAVRDLMPAFFTLLQEEEEPAVRAVLGHFFFVYIHPYIDGNGRMGRFLMNVMLASGGYPWTVIPLDTRSEYMTALEDASVRGNIEPFTQFIAELVLHGKVGTRYYFKQPK